MDLRLFYFQAMSVGAKKAAINGPKAYIDKAINNAVKESLDDFDWLFFTNLTKKEFISKLQELLNKHRYCFSHELIKDCMDLIDSNLKENFDGNHSTFHIFNVFGIAQMIINTLFKYLYLYKEQIDVKIDFSMCDCPLTKMVLNRLGRDDIKWYNLDEKTYMTLQDQIADQQDDLFRGFTFKDLMSGCGNITFELLCQISG